MIFFLKVNGNGIALHDYPGSVLFTRRCWGSDPGLVHWRPRACPLEAQACPLEASCSTPEPLPPASKLSLYCVFFFFWNKFSLCSWGWPRIPVSVLPQLLLAQFPNIGLLSSRLKVILGPDNWALTDTRKHLLVWDSSNQVFWLFWIAQELKFGPRPPISDRI